MAEQHEITWRLSDHGMDLLERAGLAGLYMALQTYTDMKEEIEQQEGREKSHVLPDLLPLIWKKDDLQPDAVTLRWSGPAKPAFVKLMEWAWQVQDGVLYLPAVHDARDAAFIQNRVVMHNGIMGTVFQHTNVQPKGEAISKDIPLDEGREVDIRYKPPIIRAPKNKSSQDDDAPKKLLRPWSDIESLFSSKGGFKPEVGLSSWALPGIGGRYGDEKNGKAWRGSPNTAILLMLAPTVCLYLRLPKTEVKTKSKNKEKRIWVDNWVSVIPDVRDLQEFAEKRHRIALSPEFADVGSLGDGAMQFLSRYSTDRPRRSLAAGCRVVAMGKVSYYPNQSIRKSVLDVFAEEKVIRQYKILHRELPNQYELWKRETDAPSSATKHTDVQSQADTITESNDEPPKAAGFFKMPTARGRIADNLVIGRPWYSDLCIPTSWDRHELERLRKRNKERNDHDRGKRPTTYESILFNALGRQRSKLMKLIAEDDMWDTEAEKVFVHAFWETLDSLYAQQAAAAAGRGGSRTVEERFDDLNDDIRRRLTQAKTRTLLRTVLADLFAKAGRQKTIRTHPAAIWRLIDHGEHWRKGHDLALLALASHRKKEDRDSIVTPLR